MGREKGECDGPSEAAESKRNGAEEMELEKLRSEQGPGLERYGLRSRNTRVFSGRIIHCLLREPESKPPFPSQCFLPQK